jgi:hypothetical protein
MRDGGEELGVRAPGEKKRQQPVFLRAGTVDLVHAARSVPVAKPLKSGFVQHHATRVIGQG